MNNVMKQDIIEILTELRPEYDFSQEVDFYQEGMLDSFDVVALVTTLEEKYKIIIDGTDILPENFSSVEKIVTLIKKGGGI